MNLEEILFIDLESVPIVVDLENDQRALGLLKKRYEKELLTASPGLIAADLTPKHYEDHLAEVGGFNSEWAKVISISFGAFKFNGEHKTFYVKNLYSDNEKDLLIEGSKTISKFETLCAHNGNEFDFPFYSRRMLIHGLPIPNALDRRGKKPWQMTNIDTLDMYRMGQFGHRAGLDLLTYVFGLPSPKGELNGADVAHAYTGKKAGYENLTMAQRLLKIATYCGGDVVSLANIFCKFTGRPIIEEGECTFVDQHVIPFFPSQVDEQVKQAA